jgi:hypothetical protein
LDFVSAAGTGSVDFARGRVGFVGAGSDDEAVGTGNQYLSVPHRILQDSQDS